MSQAQESIVLIQKDLHLTLLDLQESNISLQVHDIERDTIDFRKAVNLIDQYIEPETIVLSSKKI